VWAAPRVGFSLRRQGEARADLATSPGASRLDVIRQLHGPDLAAALLPLTVACGQEPTAELLHDAPGGPHARVEGFISSLAWTGRRGTLVLFINGRCVECGALKRGVEAVYGTLVPKAPKPWLFMDVRLPPRQVEVNVHPTKREVGFLHQVGALSVCTTISVCGVDVGVDGRSGALFCVWEGGGGSMATCVIRGAQARTPDSPPPPPTTTQDEVISAICREVEATLLAAMSSRTFTTQSNPTAAATSLKLAEQITRSGGGGRQRGASGGGGGGSSQQQQQGGGSGKQQQPAAYRPDKLVRADHRMRTMDAFVVRGGGGGSAAAAQGEGVTGSKRGNESEAADGAEEAAEDEADPPKEQQQQQQSGASAAALAAVGGGVPRKRRAADRDRLNFSSSMVVMGDDGGGGAAVVGDDEEMQLRGDGDGDMDVDGGGGGGGNEGAISGAAGSGGRPPLPSAAPTNVATNQQRAVRQRANPAGPPPVAAALELLRARESRCHDGLAALIKQHVFVGLADEAGEWALLQHGTRLYLLACAPLTLDLFEQQLLRRWGRCTAVALGAPLGLEALAVAGLQLEEAAGRWTVGICGL